MTVHSLQPDDVSDDTHHDPARRTLTRSVYNGVKRETRNDSNRSRQRVEFDRASVRGSMVDPHPLRLSPIEYIRCNECTVTDARECTVTDVPPSPMAT